MAQDPEAAFRHEKRLARVAVRAIDREGLPLRGLNAKDFAVLENDLPRPVEMVGQDELPLDLALVLDVSHSMKPSLRRLADGAREALRSLRPGDCVAVFTFARSPRLDLPLTPDMARVDAMLEEVARGRSRSATVLYTPIHRAAQYLGEGMDKNRRRAVLVLSDARGMRGSSESETLTALWEADATVSLLLSGGSRTSRALRARQQSTGAYTLLAMANLPKLVEKAGGETLPLEKSGNSFAKILERIRAQYTVYFTPSESAGLHKVAVRLSDETRARLPGTQAVGRKEFQLP